MSRTTMALIALMCFFAAALVVMGPEPANSKIGGTNVPKGLDCESDEVIDFVGPDRVGCVHIDVIREGR